ncbi:MAG: hypothetical protein Q8P56_01655 [Candidatus Uhrbacteria bacterium]|nr:hypothetical protein [Candidatus Uhrbacteria bacterium]
MATNHDKPVGGNPDQPPKTFEETVRDVRRGAGEEDSDLDQTRARTTAQTREDEARARSLLDRIPQAARNLIPGWLRPVIRPPVRGLMKGITRIGQSISYEAENLPFIGHALRESVGEHVYSHEPGRQRGGMEVERFYDTVLRNRQFKQFKQTFREKRRVPTPEERAEIENKLREEREKETPEMVIRQERVKEDFQRELAAGRYDQAAQVYDRVLSYQSTEGTQSSSIRDWKLQQELKRNAARKPKDRERPEDIERRLFPEGTDENLRRNDLLQDYLRILASQHIVDMITAGDDNARERFMQMFLNFSPMEKLTPDDIPLDDDDIQSFFAGVREDVRRSIMTRIEERQNMQDEGEVEGMIGQAYTQTLRRRTNTALNMGILTAEDFRAMSPDIEANRIIDPGRHLVEEGDAIADIARDRIERDFQVPGREDVIFPETTPGSEEVYNRARGLLQDAWRQDIARDDGLYSNFDKERAKILERLDIFPRIQLTKLKTERDQKTGKDIARSETIEEASIEPQLEVLKGVRDRDIAQREQAIQRLRTRGGQEEVIRIIESDINNIRRRYAQGRADLLAVTSIMTPAEIAHEVMNEEFTREVQRHLVRSFQQDYQKFDRERTEVTRVHDETYAPYRILMDSELDEVVDVIRTGPARAKLTTAVLRGGEPALRVEEDALVHWGIFTREELDARRNMLDLLVEERASGGDARALELMLVDEGFLTQEEIDALRPIIERRAASQAVSRGV